MYVIDKVDLFKLQYYTMYKLSIPVPVFWLMVLLNESRLLANRAAV
jgi:hypothetical protein